LAVAALGVATLFVTGCTAEDSQNPGGASTDFDPVLTEMRTWQGCDVAEDLQPIADFMGIKEWTSTGQGKPDSVKPGEANMDPDAMICGAGIVLDDIGEDLSGRGMLHVKVVPTPSEQLATTSYDARAKNTTDFHTKDKNVEVAKIEFDQPWDAGILYAAEEETGATSYVNVVARDGQWLMEIELSFTSDFGRQDGQEPAYPFSNEELHQWLIETYLAETHAAIEKKLADAGVV
jgi:hypothetical protein